MSVTDCFALADTQRLWCVWELYVFFSMSGESALSKVDIKVFSSESSLPLRDFDVAGAHCYSQEDEAKLRSIIEAEGAPAFNEAIREVAVALEGR